MTNNLPEISIVVPLYNEEQSIPFLINRLNKLMDTLVYKIEVVLVDDGSNDATATLMQQISFIDDRYQSVFLARNYGHQTALTAGLTCAKAVDAIMLIDGDLQDPPELLEKFYNYYLKGYEVVYAVRNKRKENVIKRYSYFLFYRILKAISYIDIPLDSGDFSLISRKVVDIINKMPEESRYIRGMRAWIGFKQIGVKYEREERIAGNSKYSFKQLFNLAYNGIFNFSEIPIKFISRLGMLTILLSLGYLGITLLKRFLYGTVPEGFTALLFTITLFSGVQLVSLGVIGEYVIRIFFQVKGRPLFIIKEKIFKKKNLMDRTYYLEYFDLERNHWWFKIRSQIIEDCLKRAIQTQQKPLSILNIGAATAATSQMLSKYGHVTSIEYDAECCKLTKEKLGIDIIFGSILELQFENNSFDIVCAFDVIEHVDNDVIAVNEMKRVCTNGGFVYITVPAFMLLWSHHDVINQHYRRYIKRNVIKLLENGGKPLFITYFNFILFFPILVFRLISKLIPKQLIRKESGSDFTIVSNKNILNDICQAIFNFERKLLSVLTFPFGVSFLLLWKKDI